MTSIQVTTLGLLIPFVGTSVGAMCVLFMRKSLGEGVQKVLTGFAAGVMTAAAVWSLIIPSIEQANGSVVPAAVGFWIGILFLLAIDKIVPHLHKFANEAEGLKSNFSKNTMMLLAVTIHNIPEGMAVGVVFASFLSGDSDITSAGAMVLALGIAIQNFPEGAIISMPLKSDGMSKGKACFSGILTGAVEPVAAVITILASGIIVPALPYLLAFAAGAMLYVVVEELIPEMSEGKHSNLATIAFSGGFTLMMVLDVVLG